jgi:hypothetical protein
MVRCECYERHKNSPELNAQEVKKFSTALVENLVKNLLEKNANSEIWGLLALCTDFVQNKFTQQSRIISTVKCFDANFMGFLPDS